MPGGGGEAPLAPAEVQRTIPNLSCPPSPASTFLPLLFSPRAPASPPGNHGDALLAVCRAPPPSKCQTRTFTHTHTHSLTLTLSHALSSQKTYAHTHTLSHSLSPTLSHHKIHTPTHTHTHALSSLFSGSIFWIWSHGEVDGSAGVVNWMDGV